MNRRKFINLSLIILSGIAIVPKICLKEIGKQIVKVKEWCFISDPLTVHVLAKRWWYEMKRESHLNDIIGKDNIIQIK